MFKLNGLDDLYRNRVVTLAHRGASAAAPANTLAAFRLAAEMGADGVELDVQLSRDGEAVVIHDFTVDGTTDGRGAVRGMTLWQLKALDAGSWFDDAFAGERIPTLQEVFDTVGHRLLVNVEIKSLSVRSRGLEAEVVRLIEDNSLAHRVIVSSFNPLSLRRVKKLNPNIPTALLYAPDMPLPLRRAWLSPIAPHEFRHPHHSMVDEHYMAWARRKGYRINVWTVNEPDEMRRKITLGVNGIITDRPGLLAEILSQGQRGVDSFRDSAVPRRREQTVLGAQPSSKVLVHYGSASQVGGKLLLSLPSMIAIDGPAASGKSTVGSLLARRLGYVFFDTGVMYRAVTWIALQRGVLIDDEAGVSALAEAVHIEVTRPAVDDGRQYTVLVDGQDVTWDIRRPEVDLAVSPVSAYAGVRRALTAQQRRLGLQGDVVMVGRDIGTVVLPEADLKIYLDATVEERAHRRWLELQARNPVADRDEVLAAMKRRDGIDSSRQLAPLRPAEGAHILDTTGLDLEQVLAQVERWV